MSVRLVFKMTNNLILEGMRMSLTWNQEDLFLQRSVSFSLIHYILYFHYVANIVS